MSIFACLDLSAAEAERLERIVAPDRLHLRPCLDADAPLDPAFARCEICFGNPPASWIEQAPGLRWVQLESVGFGEYLDLRTRPTFTNLAGFFAEPVAETALASILALYRGIDRLAELRRAGAWQGDALRPSLGTLEGAQILLFGQGAINGRLAELLAPFGCRIVKLGRGWTASELDRGVAEADIVVCAVPDVPATRQVFDRDRLGLMRPDSLFVNLGRGSVVAEDALADALDAGRLGGAAIDVTVDEPLPTGHRFWRCPRLIMTQHTGGGSRDEMAGKLGRFEANLGHYRAGTPLIATVDFEKGY